MDYNPLDATSHPTKGGRIMSEKNPYIDSEYSFASDVSGSGTWQADEEAVRIIFRQRKRDKLVDFFRGVIEVWKLIYGKKENSP